MTNQAKDVFECIRKNPGIYIDGISEKTGWNRHIVEMSVKMMVGSGLIKETEKDEWGDFKYEALRNETI